MGQKQSRYYFCDSLYVPLDRNKHNYKNILIGLKKQYENELLNRHELHVKYLFNKKQFNKYESLRLAIQKTKYGYGPSEQILVYNIEYNEYLRKKESDYRQLISLRNKISLISLLIKMFELGIYAINNKSNKKFIKKIINEQSSTESFVTNVVNTYTRSFWELLGKYFCKDIIGIIYPYLYKDLYESLLC